MKRVTYAQLHGAPFVPGAGNLTSTFTADKMTGVEMGWDSDGLHTWFKGVYFLVPASSVFIAVLADVPKPSALKIA